LSKNVRKKKEIEVVKKRNKKEKRKRIIWAFI
jgi:hypothetical protein